MGDSRVFVGDDPSPFSTSLVRGTIKPFSDGGFIDLDTPLTGRYVVIRRQGPSLYNPSTTDSDVNQYSIREVRIYSSTNLLQYGASLVSQPVAQSSAYSAQNLIENLRARNTERGEYPILDK